MTQLDRRIEPQDVLDTAEQAILKLQENPGSVSAEERRMIQEALAEVQKYTASELMRQQAAHMQRELGPL